MTPMKPPSAMSVATPPARANIIALRLYFPLTGS
jgi:hypothetical protein